MIKNTFVQIQEFVKTKGIYGRVLVERETGLVSEHWEDGHGTEENFKKLLNCVIETTKKEKCKLWLVDLRQLKGGFGKNVKWLAEYVIPALHKAGIVKQAIIVPDDMFAQASLNDTAEAVDLIKRKFFKASQADDAYSWLVSKQ